MRSPEERKAIIELSETMNHCQISRELGIPRRTVQGIISAHNMPRSARLSRKTIEKQNFLHPKEFILTSPLAASYAYMLAMYLGDGHITHFDRSWRMRITLDCKYPGIIQECTAHAKKLYPYNRISFVYAEGCVNVSWYSKRLMLDFPQHGPGAKHTRPIILEKWQQDIVEAHPREALRGFIHSDGCRDVNTIKGVGYPRYSFSNNSADIHDLFEQAANRVGVTCARKSSGRTLFIAKRPHVNFLDTFIGPKYATPGILPKDTNNRFLSRYPYKNPTRTSRTRKYDYRAPQQKTWSKEDYTKARELYKEHQNYEEVARILNTSATTIVYIVQKAKKM